MDLILVSFQDITYAKKKPTVFQVATLRALRAPFEGGYERHTYGLTPSSFDNMA